MTLELFKTKYKTKASDSEINSEETQEQLEVLEQEHAEQLVNGKINDEEFNDLIDEYQTKYHISTQDAVSRIARDRLEY